VSSDPKQFIEKGSIGNRVEKAVGKRSLEKGDSPCITVQRRREKILNDSTAAGFSGRVGGQRQSDWKKKKVAANPFNVGFIFQ